jgi:hypothetical protein
MKIVGGAFWNSSPAPNGDRWWSLPELVTGKINEIQDQT